MREIKFRAWLPNLNKMSYDVTVYANGWIESVTDDGGEWKHKPNDASLMQYTGLKDKNGVEVYDGDVFKAHHDFGPGGFDVRQAVVRWHEIKGYQWEYWLLDQLEVIGNIYEHPHLLE